MGTREAELETYANASAPIVIPAANSAKFIDLNPGNAFLINAIGTYPVDTDERDHCALVNRIQSKAPDLMFWTAQDADGALGIKQQGTTILLVKQNAKVALKLATATCWRRARSSSRATAPR